MADSDKLTYDQIPDVLTGCDRFVQSEEFQELEGGQQDTSALCAAIGEMVVRLEQEFSQEPALAEAYATIEKLAAEGDVHVRNAVVTEVLEGFAETDGHARARIVDRLGPATKTLYERWIEQSSRWQG